LTDILQLTTELVKAQASHRRMSPREAEEYIRRVASALQSVASKPPAPTAAPAEQPATSAPSEQALTLREAARILRLSPLTVYRYVRLGKLPAERVGRSYRLRSEDVQALRDSLARSPRPRRAQQKPATRRRPRRRR